MLRRLLAALVVPAAAGTAMASAHDPPPFNAMCGDIACRVERVPARWQIVEAPDLDHLKLVYESGGCRRGNGRARLTETRSRIQIAVDQEEVVAVDTPDGRPVCTQEIRYRVLHLSLKRRVAGRRIGGGPRIERGLPRPTRVPRVLDLFADDARAALSSQGFRVKRIGPRSGPVAFQSPLPGKRTQRRTVRLSVGYGAFDAPALTACLQTAGVPTTPVRPGPGDATAA